MIKHLKFLSMPMERLSHSSKKLKNLNIAN